METKNLQQISENYQAYTDKYFLRSKQILQTENINPRVRYQVFARKDLTLKGISEAVDFVKQVAGDKVRIYALRDGQLYTANTPIMKLEGPVQELIDLETVYLGLLSGNLTPPLDMQEMRQKARAIKRAAGDKPVFYFGARHFHPELDEQIGKICYEEGFAGASTDIAAKSWNAKGLGTIPHALILSYEAYMCENVDIWRFGKGNPTVEAAKAFDRNIDKAVPRIALIDTFNREITDTVETAQAVPSLKGARIDTCGENYAEGIWESRVPIFDEKYREGKGVTIGSVWGLRRGLDRTGWKKLQELEITVSSGFNEEKTAAFMQADETYQRMYGKPLFNSIGTGSLAKPVMTTSDICAYFSEKLGSWVPLSKVGRGELPSNGLEEVVR